MAQVPRRREKSPPPQIGVLCIDVAISLLDIYPSECIRSYIAASYVKYLEGAGAEVVPIWIGRDHTYYEEILEKLNGVLIPGGAVNFNRKSDFDLPNDCVRAAKFIYDFAKHLNDKGIYFPIWGTCLGFQLLIYHSKTNMEEVRINCQHMDCSIPICFEVGFLNSKMFKNLPEKYRELMETQPFGYHYHKFCITAEALARNSIDKEWRILATNKDEKDFKFITLAEHIRLGGLKIVFSLILRDLFCDNCTGKFFEPKNYPFYGSQIHLERVGYEIMDENDTCFHSSPCIEAAQYFAEFFVSECRKCPNNFETKSELLRYSIKNFKAQSTKNHPKAHWTECYLFGASPNYPDENVEIP